MSEFTYLKNNNAKLFDSLEKIVNLENNQNYIPLYNHFFELNSNNSGKINLKTQKHIIEVIKKKNHNIYSSKITDSKGENTTSDIFFKFSPLVDPVNIVVGKYDGSNNIFTLPKHIDDVSANKLFLDKNHYSYVDSFFSFLTDKFSNDNYFVHGLEFYGTFLCNQKNFIFNAIDDIDYINKYSYFNKNLKINHTIDEEHLNLLSSYDSKTIKKPIKLQEGNICDLDITDEIDLKYDSLFVDNKNENNESETIEMIYNKEITSHSTTSRSSTASSKTSNTDDNVSELDDLDEDEDEDEDFDEDFDEDEDTLSTISEEAINITVNKVPIQLICMETCEKTLDHLLINYEIEENEFSAILMQVIMILITYQKHFKFTHNDLHTNNIMYTNTDKEYLYYCVNNTYYKVPTYGKIYKIIDFGRSIYTYNSKLLCSNSFSKIGDAYTQYNCEPYFNKNKPRIEPNYSFDLCRLACSIFDYIIRDYRDLTKIIKNDRIADLINDWCTNDYGKNIMYKSDGSDRYTEFKSYKMISRTVHNHIPIKQLEREIFKQYIVPHKKIKKTVKIMNIDKMII